ncbi:Glycinin G1 [Morus notabilis]|uniref:Glycinin G1 n=1 Tax=Morus notabilis TaxID=981085 RepID=W9QCC7_9ROSA|nr:Glycinin G1 [Morus notabilis]
MGNLGTLSPDFTETFEESQQGQGHIARPEDHQQELRSFKEGDILSIPAEVAYWIYNNGDQKLIFVTLLNISNVEN